MPLIQKGDIRSLVEISKPTTPKQTNVSNAVSTIFAAIKNCNPWLHVWIYFNLPIILHWMNC